MKKLTHLNTAGEAAMVDVSHKPLSIRRDISGKLLNKVLGLKRSIHEVIYKL